MPTCDKILAVLILPFMLSCTQHAQTHDRYAEATVEMSVKKMSEHVYYVEGKPGVATDNQGFISNSGFIITDDGVVIFDALGTPSLAAKLVKKIRVITDKPIKRVVVSHYHADHIYGLQVFEDLGATIYAPLGAQKYLQSEAAKNRIEERQVSLYPWVNDDTRLVLPDVTVSKSDQFKLGGLTFTINYVGQAHSDGDLTLLVEPDRILFSGDIIFEARIPFAGNADSKHWLDTLTKLETTGLSALIPGHGPASTNPKSTITLTRQYLSYLRETMGAAVDEFQPFDEAYAQTDWSAFKSLPAFDASNRINAYQIYLSMEAELLAK